DLAAEVAREALAPALLAGRRLQADEVAVRAERVREIAVHGGRASRAAVLVLVRRSHLRRPEALAVGLAQGDDVLRTVAIAHREDPPARHRHRGEAAPEARRLPRQGRSPTLPPRDPP